MRRMIVISILFVLITVTADAAVYIPGLDPSPAAVEGKCIRRGPGGVEALMGIEPTAEHTYDVRKYTLDFYIDDVAETITATVTVNLDLTEDNLSVQLDFDDAALTISTLTVDGITRSYTHENELLTMDISGGGYAIGDNLDVAVTYSGDPLYGLYFGGDFDSEFETCFTFDEPTDSKYWFPCYDYPSDKAENGAELYIDVRDDWDVASIGLLVETTTPEPGRKRYHWRHEHSIAQYLIAFSAADYYQFSDTWEGLPLDYWVLPDQALTAPISFANVPDMFECFEAEFDDYAYKDEKYGMYIWARGGAMEHQTNSGMVEWTGDGDDNDHIIAHELAHQWWGDDVTCATWADIWLNEGFATYSDALFHEYRDGPTGLSERMIRYRNSYFDEDEEYRFPVYDPDYMWSATVYEKGAWVLHMLRNEMASDDQFFGALKHYRAQRQPDVATTAQLIEDIEAYTGEDWSWFFQQWVYKAGYPELEWAWNATDDDEVTVWIKQNQVVDSQTPIFKFHIDLDITTDVGSERHTVWMDGAERTFGLTTAGKATAITLDPDTELLYEAYGPSDELPTAVRLAQNRPNPVEYYTVFVFVMPTAGDAELNLYDIKGRKIEKILHRKYPAGEHRVYYACDLPNGVYIYHLRANDEVRVKKMVVTR
ncbi:MAG: T9SS type A sorting domain-containing protein [bacterium]|nr:T9SS type A sorting domain-containing protein [bacterium]